MRVAVVSQQRPPKIQASSGKKVGKRQARTKNEDGLGAFGEAAQIVERLAAAQLGREAAFGGHDREREEGRAGADEANSRKAAARRCGGVGDREGEDHARVDDEVEDDVEKAAEVGRPRCAGDRAVQAVGEAVEQEKREAERVGLAGDRGHGREAEDEADQVVALAERPRCGKRPASARAAGRSGGAGVRRASPAGRNARAGSGLVGPGRPAVARATSRGSPPARPRPRPADRRCAAAACRARRRSR